MPQCLHAKKKRQWYYLLWTTHKIKRHQNNILRQTENTTTLSSRWASKYFPVFSSKTNGVSLPFSRAGQSWQEDVSAGLQQLSVQARASIQALSFLFFTLVRKDNCVGRRGILSWRCRYQNQHERWKQNPLRSRQWIPDPGSWLICGKRDWAWGQRSRADFSRTGLSRAPGFNPQNTASPHNQPAKPPTA